MSSPTHSSSSRAGSAKRLGSLLAYVVERCAQIGYDVDKPWGGHPELAVSIWQVRCVACERGLEIGVTKSHRIRDQRCPCGGRLHAIAWYRKRQRQRP